MLYVSCTYILDIERRRCETAARRASRRLRTWAALGSARASRAQVFADTLSAERRAQVSADTRQRRVCGHYGCGRYSAHHVSVNA